MGTSWPVVIVDRSNHVEPSQMKDVVRQAIEKLLEEQSAGQKGQASSGAEPLTVLVAMGFCGGAWDHVSFPCRIVVPRVDDCISMLLATDDKAIPNRKEIGHLYLYENDPKDFSALHLIRDGGTADEMYRGMSRDDLFRYWFGNYPV